MNIIYDKKTQIVPIKVWSDLKKIEPKAIDQLKNTAALPFVFKHVAAMPDVHWGLGATVGSVIATKGAICPAAVGVDIGCGMMAVKTDLDHRIVQDKVKEIRHSIERSIPLGPGGARQKISEKAGIFEGWNCVPENISQDEKLLNKARNQIGTLGSGNHFIEICVDTDNAVWVMLHSGSRGIGNIVARRFIESAKGLMKERFISLPDPDLAYLCDRDPQMRDYMRHLIWLQEYAFQNRIEMMALVLKDLSYAVYKEELLLPRLEEVNCHHNYVAKEHHFGSNVYVTRKGAVRARNGDMGIIPGSMGTRSYIVEGLGNDMSFHSCSHGAGRVMSRTDAKRKFTKEDLVRLTEGVECRKDEKVLDEIPLAYKDIDEVMDNQKDLVRIKYQLKQICCVKG